MVKPRQLLQCTMAKIKRYTLSRRLKKNGYECPVSLNNNYFVTTELGIFYISSDYIRLLTTKPGYGLAIDKKRVYYSYDDKKWSIGNIQSYSNVVSADINDLINGKLLKEKNFLNLEKLYCQPFISNNGRIHQVSFFNKDAGGGG